MSLPSEFSYVYFKEITTLLQEINEGWQREENTLH